MGSTMNYLAISFFLILRQLERERERSVPVLELNKAASPYTEAEAVLKRQRFHSSDDQASVCKPHTEVNYLVWKSINVH